MEIKELIKVLEGGGYESLDTMTSGALSGVNHLHHDIYKIPNTSFVVNEEDIAKFNRIVDLYHAAEIPTFQISQKGCILNSTVKNFVPCKGMYLSNTKCYIVFLNVGLKDYKFCFERDKAFEDGDTQHISPANVIKKITKLAKEKDGTDLKKYYIEDGSSKLDQVEKPMISGKEELFGQVLINCHHLDINSAYPAGLVNAYPDLTNTFKYLFDTRKTNPENKLLMNRFIGVCHSVKWGQHANYVDLAIAAKKWCNDYIKNYINILEGSGRKILAINTDGIWYQGEIYHDENEGKELGQWKNDHVNCIFRMKSGGAYEYMENGKYTPVVRGFTRLDKIKPRTEWEWGDIYKTPIMWYVIEKDGHITPRTL